MDWFDLGFPQNETFREKMQIFSQNFAFFSKINEGKFCENAKISHFTVKKIKLKFYEMRKFYENHKFYCCNN